MATKQLKSKYVAPVSMKVISFGKKYIANTWIHRLPITEWAYRKIFYLGIEVGETTISFRNMKLTVHTKDISMVPALINNNFEEYELELFHHLIRRGTTVIDIGANIGVYSLIAAIKTGKKGKVFSFEPVPENYELLKKNLYINDLKNVVPINSAVGDFTGEIQMEIEKNSLATHHVSSNPKNPVAVKVTTIDTFVKKRKITDIELIKMDIEGYEGFAIDGAQKTLSNPSIKLLTEFSADFIVRSGKDPKQVGNQLLNIFKYCYHVDEKHKRLLEVRDINDLLDYKKTNFLFTHKKYEV